MAFSLGFIVGPLIGAIFAVWAKKKVGDWFIVPALFALLLSLADLIFFVLCFKETLPEVKNIYYADFFLIENISGKTCQKH